MIIGISGKIGSGKDTVGQIIQYLTWCESVNSSDLPDFEEWSKDRTLNAACAITIALGYGGWEIKKFAGKLKQIVALLTGCTVEQLEDQEFKQRKLPRDWDVPYPGNTEDILTKPMTYREMLQKVGTEAMRDNVHTNVWVNALFADYKTNYVGSVNPIEENIKLEDVLITPIYPDWIITDMRFPNELEAVKKHGGITIRISRMQFFKESDLRNPDYVVKHEHPSETSLDDAKFDHTIDNNGSIEELIEKVREILITEKII